MPLWMHHSLWKGSKTLGKKDLQSCNSSLCALIQKYCNHACKAKLYERGIPSMHAIYPIGIGAGPTGLVLTGSHFPQFNEIHYSYI